MAEIPLTHQSFVLRFFAGFGFALQGLGNLFASPGRMLLALAPALITLGVFVGLLAGAALFVPDLVNEYIPLGELSAAQGWWEITAWVLLLLARILLYLVTALAWIAAFLTLFLGVSDIFSSPFCELISEQIEQELTGVATPDFQLRRFIVDVGSAVAHSLLSLVILIVGEVLLALLGWLVPVIGSILAFVGSGVLLGMFFCLNGLDSAASRRQWSYGRKLGTVWNNFWVMAGFACACIGIVMVPVLNLLAVPAMTTGGTRLLIALEQPRS